MSFPYLAKTTLKYKSPHATDLSFAKGETIRVTGPSEDDEDWLVGELLDGSKSGGFPKDFIERIEEEDGPAAAQTTEPAVSEKAPAASQPNASTDVTTEESPAAAAAAETAAPPPMPATAPAPPSPTIDPKSLPPSSTASPAPTASVLAQASAAEGDNEASPSKQSMKDRLAFFAAAQNKAAAPPPPIKPKPAAGGLTWSQRQKLRQEEEAKEREAAGGDVSAASAPPAAATTTASEPAVAFNEGESTATAADKDGEGMSAADAQTSISKGGSLRERMAALQSAGAFGAPAGEAKPAPPKPSGKVWTRPPAPPAPEPEEADEDEAAGTRAPRLEDAEGGDAVGPGQDADAKAAGDGGAEEEDEEAQEKARRAAIAARMAKLGARGPMGMPPPLAPKPVRKPTQDKPASATGQSAVIAAATEAPAVEPTPETTEEVKQETPAAPVEPEDAPPAASSPPTTVPLPAVPRRAAPPRRRGAAPTAAAAAATGPVSPSAVDDPAELEKRLETTDEDGNIHPPPQVMVANEEASLPKTAEQIDREARYEEAGRSAQGAEGAKAAGIAVMPVGAGGSKAEGESEPLDESTQHEPLVGAVGEAGNDSRGTGAVAEQAGPGEILDGKEDEPREIEDGVEEGGEEEDDIMQQAKRGNLQLDEKPFEPATVPVQEIEDREQGEEVGEEDEEEAAPPPPPPRMMGFGKDEVQLKHEQEAQEDDGEEEGRAPPPPPRLAGVAQPGGPRAMPPVPTRDTGAGTASTGALPPPPVGDARMPPPDDEDDEEAEARDEPAKAHEDDGSYKATTAGAVEEYDEDGEDAAAPPPPPRRQSTLPVPVQTGVPQIVDQAVKPASRAPDSPVNESPQSTMMPPPAEQQPEDEEAARKANIAARMAKLGGVKFGMPPPVPSFKKPSADSEGPASPVREMAPRSPVREKVVSPTFEEPTTEATPVEASGGADDDGEETPEQEAARRRATLARLRAGGALGFGMFNHGPAGSAAEETRAEEPEEEASAPPPVPAGRPAQALPPPPGQAAREDDMDEEDDDVPPPVPASRPMPVTPVQDDEREEEDEQAPPPPPPARQPSLRERILPPIIPEGAVASDAPASPRSPRAAMPSPIRSPSGRRPPVPAAEKRYSQQSLSSPTTAMPRASAERTMVDEPVGMMGQPAMGQDEDEVHSPPPRPVQAAPLQQQQQQPEVRRSMSVASRSSRVSEQGSSGFAPASRQQSRMDSSEVARAGTPSSGGMPAPAAAAGAAPVMAAGGRPDFKTLQLASQDAGARLARAAKAIFDQGKKGNYGDGSPAGFVLRAMDSAQLPRPQQYWGQVVFEQEAASVLKRYDEPRPGDIAAFHDARLKGKKGLTSYNQQVGSVEEPLVGVVLEFEQKKHKIRVLQVERGHPEEVSYRCDDLKSGRIVVYRPGLPGGF